MGPKILIIEDDKFLRELIAKKLNEEGFGVDEAVDGEEGLRKSKEGKPNLILLDLILPGIDGFEVLAKIKQDPEIKSIPVIILSNLGQKEDIEKGIKLGAFDYLVKAHFTPGEIIEKVRNALK
jgi:DNA-binding response OmpR family regulator